MPSGTAGFARSQRYDAGQIFLRQGNFSPIEKALLSRERIAWELDRLKANGFPGVNVTYTGMKLGHSCKGAPDFSARLGGGSGKALSGNAPNTTWPSHLTITLQTHANPQSAAIDSRIRWSLKSNQFLL
ncbi:MAG: hypothetical protein ACYTEQ_14125 [Planctomycetota bacterium]|jgi:hypothetical protein